MIENNRLIATGVLAMGLLVSCVGRGQDDKVLLQEGQSVLSVKKVAGGFKQIRQLQESVDAGDFYQTPSGPRKLYRLSGRFAVRGQGGKNAVETLAPLSVKGQPFAGYTRAAVGKDMLVLSAPETGGTEQKMRKADTTSERTALHGLRQSAGIRIDPVFIDPDSGLQRIVGTDIIVCLKPSVDAKTYFGDELAHASLMPGTKNQYILTLDKDSAEAVLEDCLKRAADERVEWAEPDFQGEIIKNYTPNDTYFSSQWHLKGTGTGSVQAQTAWDTAKGDGIVIAIVDDGVQVAHPDLQANIFVNSGEIAGNGIDDDGNGYADDVSGWNFAEGTASVSPADAEDSHGTAVAGVAAAVGNNGAGVAGVAFCSKILPVKMSIGTNDFATSSEIAAAFRYAAGLTGSGWRGADVINFSWSYSQSTTLDSALTAAATNGRGGKGCPIFISSGNKASGWYRYSFSGVPSGTHTLKFEYAKDSSDSAGLDRVWLDDVYLPGVGTEGFEGATFPPSGWSTGGHSSWAQNTDSNYAFFGTGVKSARSGTLGNSQTNYLQVTKTLSAGTITFWLWTSTEERYDVVNVYFDGIKQRTDPGGVYGYSTSISYPASHASTIAIGASTDADIKADYSQYGTGLDFIAPSGGGTSGIYTTDRTGTDGYSSSSYTSDFSGTSSASPLAAGIGALILSKNSSLTASEVRSIMRRSCAKIGGVTYSGGDSGAGGWNTYYGYGRITASTALANTPATAVSLSVTVPPSGGSATSSPLTNDGSTWTFDCTGRPAWITSASVSMGSGNVFTLGTGTYGLGWTGSGTVSVSASANTTGATRSWVLPITTPGGTTYQITFSQAASEDSPPSAPTGVSAGDGSSTANVGISWTASSGATGYSVYRGTSSSASSSSLLGSASGTSYTDSTATPGTLYYYWVKASNGAGTSDFSPPETGHRALSAPTGVNASDTASDAVTVSWSAVTGASYYRVYRATSSSGTKTALGSWQTALSYSDASATTGTTYYYWVMAAVDSSGTRPSAYSSYDTGVMSTVSVPTAPTDMSASDGSSTTSVIVSWTASSGATGYSVYRGTSSSASSSSLLGSASGTSYTDSTATPGTLYYYWVKASNGAGTSDFSPSETGHRALSAPTGVNASDMSPHAVTVTWDSVTGASFYRVYRAETPDGAKTTLGGWQTSRSYFDTSAIAGTTYYYWIRAWIYDYDYLLLGNVYPSAYSTYDIGVRVESPPKEFQQITFQVLPAKKYGDPDFSVEATASSGLAVTLSSGDTTVATVIGDKIHIVGTGKTSIIASQAGDDMYDPATNVSQVLTIEKASLTVTAKNQNKVARDTKVLDSKAYSVSGLIGSDTVVGITLSSPGATASADVGVYLITPSLAQGDGLENYQIDYIDGNLTVTPSPYHVADLNKDGVIEYETELIRLFQLASSGTFHTASNTVDGYMQGSGVQVGIAHDSDFSPKDWSLNMRTELLRAIQIRNAGGYYRDVTSIDGFGITSNLVTHAPYLVINVSGGTNTANYPVSYLSEVPVDGWTEEYKTTKIVLRRLPSQPLDTFMMGALSNELGRTIYETNHLVSLTRRLYSGGCVYDVLPRSGTMGSAITYLTPTQTVFVAANAEIKDASATGDQPDSIRVSGDKNQIRMAGGISYIGTYGNDNSILAGSSNDTVFVIGDRNYVDLWKGDDFCYLNGMENIVYGLWGNDVFEVYGENNFCVGDNDTDSYYCTNSAQNTLKLMEITLSLPPAHPVLPLYSDMRAGVDSYFIGVFEITQKQWEFVMGDRPSFFTNETSYASRPVECISYNDACAFVEKLKARTGVAGIGLPTEAVWEYACRAGSNTAFNNGAIITNVLEDASLNCLGRYRYNDGFVLGETLPLADSSNVNGTARVGSYLPNGWELYDMHGNVAEWCVDWFSPFGTEHISNPIGSVSNQLGRTIRGGNWSSTASSCRSASRTSSAPNEGQRTCGVRLFVSSPFQ